MSKIKVFISQPMNGKTKEQIEKERLSVKLSKDCEVLPSLLECKDNPKHRSVWYLAKSLEIMAEADVAFFMKGWEESRGCQIEHEIAKQYGIKIKYEEVDKELLDYSKTEGCHEQNPLTFEQWKVPMESEGDHE